jgi:hypothetical protein
MGAAKTVFSGAFQDLDDPRLYLKLRADDAPLAVWTPLSNGAVTAKSGNASWHLAIERLPATAPTNWNIEGQLTIANGEIYGRDNRSKLEQLNAQQRRQGVIDELLDRPVQSLANIKYDPAGKEAKSKKYTIISTRTDNFDRGKAKSNCEDAIAAYPDLACVVGLFAYNTPMCLEALRTANKLGQIKVASFDEADATLDGIAAGHVQGTVSQQPNLYGYHSIRILAALARGDNSVLPKDGFLEVPIVVVRKDNVAGFREKLMKLKAE